MKKILIVGILLGSIGFSNGLAPKNVIETQGKGGAALGCVIGGIGGSIFPVIGIGAGCTIGGFIGDYVGDLFGYTSIEKLQPKIEIISPEAQKKFNKTYLNLEIERP